MKASIKLDLREISRTFQRARLSEKDMLNLAGSGAKPILNVQRSLVPVDTAATKLSVSEHISEASDTRGVDDIGPETNYAIYLEYGTGEYAEDGSGRKGGWAYEDAKGQWHFTRGMHPRAFVRPSIFGNESDIISTITATYLTLLRIKWIA